MPKRAPAISELPGRRDRRSLARPVAIPTFRPVTGTCMPMRGRIKTLHSATGPPIPSSCVAIAGESAMTAWICRTCGVEHADTSAPPAVCRICSDERQYVLPTGQQWTTLEELSTEGRRGAVEDVEIGLFGVTVTPKVGIGQRALLLQTPRSAQLSQQDSALRHHG